MTAAARGIVGLLGGTFDPVHFGHLRLASGAMNALGLERVVLVPAAIPPHKPREAISSAEHRMAMLRLAVAGAPGLEVDPIEIDRGGISFTIDTLRAIRDRSDVAGVVFLLGMDSLAELPGWREADRLVEEFDLVVVDRPGNDLARVREAAPRAVAERLVGWNTDAAAAGAPLGAGGRIFHLPLPPVEVSSRAVRARAAGSGSLAALVPPAVARYIRRHGLYRSGGVRIAAAGSEGGSTLTPEIAVCIAAARDKKAEDLVVLDLRKSDFTDYLVICHGTNDRQIVAIADSIETRLRNECGVKPSHVEGRRESSWILMDYIDFVVHVFDPDKRRFYRLERLWGDAPRVDLPEEGPPASTSGAAAP